jgi:hypothetical protein
MQSNAAEVQNCTVDVSITVGISGQSLRYQSSEGQHAAAG